jgi:hypothetical protein
MIRTCPRHDRAGLAVPLGLGLVFEPSAQLAAECHQFAWNILGRVGSVQSSPGLRYDPIAVGRAAAEVNPRVVRLLAGVAAGISDWFCHSRDGSSTVEERSVT